MATNGAAASYDSKKRVMTSDSSELEAPAPSAKQAPHPGAHRLVVRKWRTR
jgi:hypothetical protein